MFARFLISLALLSLAVSISLRGGDVGAIHIAGRTYFSRAEFVASGARCRTAPLSLAAREAMELKLAAIPESAGAPIAARIATVQVYFHILTSSSGEGDLDDATISKQMDVLNQDYANSNAKVTFVLAGTERKTDDSWYQATMDSDAEKELKAALRTDKYSDLNIYTTAQPDGTLGWATYPGPAGSDFSYDGVIVDYRSFPGGDFFPYNEGRTVTHEVGHWMGLFHTFEGGCAQNESGGDEVRDTPAERDANAGCPPDSTNTCPGNSGAYQGNDPIHNYMDYTDDSCMNNFTPGQVERMRRSWVAYRA